MFNLQQLLIKNNIILRNGETTNYGATLEKLVNQYTEEQWLQLTYQKQLLSAAWNREVRQIDEDIQLVRLRIHHRKVDAFLFGEDIVNV